MIISFFAKKIAKFKLDLKQFFKDLHYESKKLNNANNTFKSI
ncbi:hypothetical protein Q757_09630 [Oenococcus alcoholitolerans]|uniref:Uncharacterized protein n=1 Tax=Oenococcus alcoholitolerans TaxID=931074 RepID=A0ABR4XNR1_9LACO|nr:hypothetical protein Q757_09630 [Oenococcus alcoholitolerans]